MRVLAGTRETSRIGFVMIGLTLAISCGARRARTLRAPFRGDVGRSRASKVRARPTRQLHRVVRRPVTTDCMVQKCRALSHLPTGTLSLIRLYAAESHVRREGEPA